MQDLGPCYQAAVAEEDLQKSLNLCRVFTSASSLHTQKLSREKRKWLHAYKYFPSEVPVLWPDFMIALLARLECEDNEKLEASTEQT